MAVDAFLKFSAGGKACPLGETQDSLYQKCFEIKDFSFGIEAPHSIGSATGGAGAGKAKFNEFTIKKTTDKSSPIFFKALGSGIHYPKAQVYIRKAGGDPNSTGKAYLVYTFGLVFVTKIDWSGPGDEGPEESITFAYAQLHVGYWAQDSTGARQGPQAVAGWDVQKNKSWDDAGGTDTTGDKVLTD